LIKKNLIHDIDTWLNKKKIKKYKTIFVIIYLKNKHINKIRLFYIDLKKNQRKKT